MLSLIDLAEERSKIDSNSSSGFNQYLWLALYASSKNK